jgi:hypothetical protein|tara:strand:+ start:503 stop:2050 length:1548 start_codon:yes stop_codon:yes gene_type:complete
VPKKEHQILGFHGGINDNSDPKDIEDVELREADGVSVHKLGRLVSMGNTGTGLTNLTNTSYDIKKGYGLHFFSTDKDKDGANNPEDWLAFYSNVDHKVKFYYRDKSIYDGGSDEDPNVSSLEVHFTGGTIKPNYYFADGALRIGDATFSQSSKWHGFVDSILFQTDNNGATNNVLGINKWVSSNQRLRGFDELLGNGNLKLVNSDTTNLGAADSNATGTLIGALSSTSDGDVNGRKLFLSYWKGLAEDGSWNGTYQFAATPVYMGDQEGPISIFPTTLNFKDNQVVFQVHIPIGTGGGSAIADDANLLGGFTNPLGDERIIGVNFYFRSSGDEDWKFLMNTDLLEGGPNHWSKFVQSEFSHGIFDGTMTIMTGTSPNDDLQFVDASGNAVTSGSAGSKLAPSYTDCFLRVVLDNNNTNGFTSRYGFIRVWGGYVSPVWLNADSSGNPIPLATSGSNDTYDVPIILPGEGTREFMVELLDENFTVIKQSDKETMSITDSGKEPPPDYETTIQGEND